jgi:tyrosine-protein phosphatase SIW14
VNFHRLFFFPALAVFFLLAAFSPASAQTSAPSSGASSSVVAEIGEKLKISGVPNAGKISDFLMRGAQPSQSGFLELKKLGVTTVVDLREKGYETQWERQVAESIGFTFINIPVRGWSPPSDLQVAQFLSLFHNASGQRVFVHCRFGDDRTGVMVASYRLAQQDWSADRAVREMYYFGFHYHLYRNMESYVRHLPNDFASASVFAPLRAAPAAAPSLPRP